MKAIKNMNDVKTFAHQLCDEELNFHPDTDFSDYINLTTENPTYNKEQAEERNRLVKQCFSVCRKEKKDIYLVMGKIFDKRFPLLKVN